MLHGLTLYQEVGSKSKPRYTVLDQHAEFILKATL